VLVALKRTADDGTYFFPILKTITIGPTDRDYTDEFDWYEASGMTSGNYTISLYVSPSASGGNDVEDTNLANNIANEAHTVRTRTWNVDMDGTGKIDILDIFVAASSFGAIPGQPRFDARADINGDGLIDIRDIFQIARAFGKSFTDVYHL
jgi:hypothetical protein